MSDRYGYIAIETLLNFCENSKDHAVTPNDFMRMARVRVPEPEQRWIPVSERLPEPRVDVWVNSDIGQIQGYYEEHVGVWYASFGQGRDYLELIVNAWMPLPEPYREERIDE